MLRTEPCYTALAPLRRAALGWLLQGPALPVWKPRRAGVREYDGVAFWKGARHGRDTLDCSRGVPIASAR